MVIPHWDVFFTRCTCGTDYQRAFVVPTSWCAWALRCALFATPITHHSSVQVSLIHRLSAQCPNHALLGWPGFLSAFTDRAPMIGPVMQFLNIQMFSSLTASASKCQSWGPFAASPSLSDFKDELTFSCPSHTLLFSVVADAWQPFLAPPTRSWQPLG